MNFIISHEHFPGFVLRFGTTALGSQLNDGRVSLTLSLSYSCCICPSKWRDSGLCCHQDSCQYSVTVLATFALIHVRCGSAQLLI